MQNAITWQQIAADDYRYAQLFRADEAGRIKWMEFSASASAIAREYLFKLIEGNRT